MEKKMNGQINQSCPIVDLHASWLALNPIHGCINSCKYCFLNKYNIRGIKPNIPVEPKAAYELLKASEYYCENFPLCLFTSTDVFATKMNIDYCLELLELFSVNKLKNNIVFITKCFIPKDFIEKVKIYMLNGLKVLFLLSYSGLDKDIEIGVNKENIKANFVNLKANNIPVIHYWRPFLEQNSTDEKINEVLSFVKDYAICSVTIGLKIDGDDQIQLLPMQVRELEDIKASESVWTENAYNKLYLYKGEYPIFKTTSCAIAYAQGENDYCGFYGSNLCVNFNNCPKTQREICKNKNGLLKVDEIKEKINFCLNKFNLKYSYDFILEKRLIKIYGKLNTNQAVFIKLLTNCNVEVFKSEQDYYWNSTNNTKHIFIIKG